MALYKETELTRDIIGIAMRVHRGIGPGFQEKVYHHALAYALVKELYQVESEKEFDVIYDTIIVGNFRIDLLVDGKVIVELKAVAGEMPKLFHTQTISYLKASGVEVGLLINFGNQSLEIKRFANYNNHSV